MWGLDMREGLTSDGKRFGNYTTDLFTHRAVQVIKSHDGSKPMFLYVAHLAVHSANGYQPLQAPLDTIQKFSYIQDNSRRIFAAMVSKLDDSVGAIVKALGETNMLMNSIIVFSTDNGGPAAGFNSNAASNWPLRGVKDTMWEGGVRGSCLVWSPVLPRGVSDQLMHITDWLPTLLSATGNPLDGEEEDGLDGVNLWDALRSQGSSPRREVLLNIDPVRRVAGYRFADWKILEGNTWEGVWNGWYGPTGRDTNYNWRELYSSPAAVALSHIRPLPSIRDIQLIRAQTYLDCLKPKNNTDVEDFYLFNIAEDPCELVNLAKSRADLMQFMKYKLDRFKTSMVKPRNVPIDPRANPKYWDYSWTNWMDFAQSFSTII